MLLLIVGLDGCHQRGPVEDLSPLLEGVGDPTRTPVGLSAELFRVLDEASQKALESRASELSKDGLELEAGELIQARGVGLGVRVSEVELLERGADRARLRVHFAAVADSGPGDKVAREPVDFDAVLEEERWRIALPELTRVVGGEGVGGGGRR